MAILAAGIVPLDRVDRELMMIDPDELGAGPDAAALRR
jgi:hypothetical protein